MKTWAHNGKRIGRCKTSEVVDEICAKKIDMWVVATFLKDCWAFWHSLLAELHCWQCWVWMEVLTLSVSLFECDVCAAPDLMAFIALFRTKLFFWTERSHWQQKYFYQVCHGASFQLSSRMIAHIIISYIPNTNAIHINAGMYCGMFWVCICLYYDSICMLYQHHTYQSMLVCIGNCNTYQYFSSILGMYCGVYCSVY